jgi:hypothetical protein
MRTKNYFTTMLVVTTLLVGQSCSRRSTQSKFATPDDAVKALLEALSADKVEQLQAIFGPEALATVASGDAVSDKQDREVVRLAIEQSWRWVPLGADRQELIIGQEQWPFPIPLAKLGAQWQFDSEAGKQEVIARRIGRNELGVIDLCHGYVDLQREYAAESRDGKAAGLFAQQLRSTPGHHDGLYWETSPGEEPSPLGDLVAQAEDEGYARDQTEGSPFWGYRFRILTAQGEAARGGKRSYIVNGDMSGGFALVAYPAKYGSSGVMTFVVNHEGAVYEKDLGKDTSSLAAHLTDYNPDDSWQLVPIT